MSAGVVPAGDRDAVPCEASPPALSRSHGGCPASSPAPGTGASMASPAKGRSAGLKCLNRHGLPTLLLPGARGSFFRRRPRTDMCSRAVSAPHLPPNCRELTPSQRSCKAFRGPRGHLGTRPHLYNSESGAWGSRSGQKGERTQRPPRGERAGKTRCLPNLVAFPPKRLEMPQDCPTPLVN